MSEIIPDREPGTSPPAVTSPQDDSAVHALGWGLFGRFFFANAGTLFLMAGILCFFAYNWESLPPFARFGMIGAAMLAAAASPLLRGPCSTGGRLGLLACGILAGVLMAVYGQVYQTGANAWELFRAWAFFLIPLAFLGRQAGLWFTLWLAASLWGILYLGQRADTLQGHAASATLVLYQCLAQTAFFVLWEAASRFLAGERFPFLRTRWLPRVTGVALLAFLTVVMGFLITGRASGFGYPAVYTAIYLALVGGGAFYYRVKRTDLFMMAAGLLSLIVLLIVSLLHYLEGVDSATILLAVVAVLLAGSAVSGKFLIARYRKWRESMRQSHETAQATAETEPSPAETALAEDLPLPAAFSVAAQRLALQGNPSHTSRAGTGEEPPHAARARDSTPWQAQLLMGICAWIAVPCLIVLIFMVTPRNLEPSGYSVIFLILLGIGIGASRLPGVFFGQAALCLCLTGAAAAGALIGMETGNRTLCLLPAIVIFAVSAFPARNNSYRFLAITLAITLLFFQADLYFYAPGWGHYLSPETAEGTLPDSSLPLLAVFGLIYAACAVALARAWRKTTRNGPLVLQRHPFVAALFAVPLLLGLFSVLSHASGTLAFLFAASGRAGISIRMAGIGAAAGMGYLLFRLAGDLDVRAPVRVILALSCLPVAIISWHMPWFGIGLLGLLMARQAKSLVLLGTAVFFLAVGILLEYYALSTTLLVKSLSLGGIGIFLLLCAVGLHRYMARCLREGTLRIPRSLLPVSAHRPPGDAAGDDITAVSARRNPGRTAQAILAGTLLAFFVFFSHAVHQKEQLLDNGERVILALRPVDPRSLMQGDYMLLSLDMEHAIHRALQAGKSPYSAPDAWLQGTAIATPDEEGVFHFVRLDDGAALQPGEVRLVYRGKRDGPRVGPGAFFFQEGHGKIFERARFAELRAGKDGETLVTHLLDENRQRIQPGQDRGRQNRD